MLRGGGAEGGTAWSPAGPPGSAHGGLQWGRASGKTPERRPQSVGSWPQSRAEVGAVPGAPCPAALLVQHPPLVPSPRLRAGAARGPPGPIPLFGGRFTVQGSKAKTPPARPRDGSEAAMAQWDTGGVIAPVWVGSASPSPLRSQGHAVPPGRHGAMGHSGGHGAHPLGPTSPQHHRHPVRRRGSDPRPWDVPEVLAEGGER